VVTESKKKNPLSRIAFSLGISILIVALVLRLAEKEEPPAPEHLNGPPQISQPPALEETNLHKNETPATLGDQLLKSYASTAGTLENDLKLFTNFLSNVFLLVKERDPRHYATNEDLTLFLTGQQGTLTPYLSMESPLINAEGQLIDRFQSPLIIHPISRDRIEIRSSGPDLTPYTGDDVVR
jgi:hypothetical protein